MGAGLEVIKVQNCDAQNSSSEDNCPQLEAAATPEENKRDPQEAEKNAQQT